MDFLLRPMQMDDISQVVAIEGQSFPTPWSSYAFTCELCDNEFAYYLVVAKAEQPDKVVGYGGMWIIIDEAHITNIAIAPIYRGKSLSKMLLEGMFLLALQKKVCRMTLEVRVSNGLARNLYGKMGFQEAGIRPGYYVDTNEDALIMWKELCKGGIEINVT